VYAGLPAPAGEPPKRLVAWTRVVLAPGESKTVTLPLAPLHLSVFDVKDHRWQVVPGDYRIFAGRSSRDLPLSATVTF